MFVSPRMAESSCGPVDFQSLDDVEFIRELYARPSEVHFLPERQSTRSVSPVNTDRSRARAMLKMGPALAEYADAIVPHTERVFQRLVNRTIAEPDYGGRPIIFQEHSKESAIYFGARMSEEFSASEFFRPTDRALEPHVCHMKLLEDFAREGLTTKDLHQFEHYVVKDGLVFATKFITSFADVISEYAKQKLGLQLDPGELMASSSFKIAMNQFSHTGSCEYTNAIFMNECEDTEEVFSCTPAMFASKVCEKLFGKEQGSIEDLLDLFIEDGKIALKASDIAMAALVSHRRRQNFKAEIRGGDEVWALNAPSKVFSTSGCPAARGAEGLLDPDSAIGRFSQMLSGFYMRYVEVVKQVEAK